MYGGMDADGQLEGRTFLQPSSMSCLQLNWPRTAVMYDRPGREGPPTTGIARSCIMRGGQHYEMAWHGSSDKVGHPLDRGTTVWRRG